MNNQVELTRHNITLSAFFAAIRQQCKKNNIDFDINIKDFAKPIQESNRYYNVINGKKIVTDDNRTTIWDGKEAAAEAETMIIKPYEYHIYVRNFDGTIYNEICEFTFDNDKTGTGYYYQANIN